MSVFLLPKLMVEAFGGVENLRRNLQVGELHYTYVYPDGAFEISTKDSDSLRLLVRDPTQDDVVPSAKISFRSLAPFGAVAHRVSLPEKINRRVLKDSFFIYPGPSSRPVEAEFVLHQIGVSVTVERFDKQVRSELVQAFRTTVATIPSMDSRWETIPPQKVCPHCFVEGARISAAFDLAALDQRVLNWFALNVLSAALSPRRSWGRTDVHLFDTNAFQKSKSAECVDISTECMSLGGAGGLEVVV